MLVTCMLACILVLADGKSCARQHLKRAEKGTSVHYKKKKNMLCADIFLFKLLCRNANWSTKDQTGARWGVKGANIFSLCLKQLHDITRRSSHLKMTEKVTCSILK